MEIGTIDDRIAENMKKAYVKIATSVIELEPQIREYTWAPIFLDGVPVSILLNYVQDVIGIPKNPFIDNVFYASSKKNELDRATLGKICSGLEAGQFVCGIDLRSETGSLGSMLHREAGIIYAVLFDSSGEADFCGSYKRLTDEERPLWLRGKDKVDKLMIKENGKYTYNFKPDTIIDFDHVGNIKDEIKKQIQERA